MTTNPATTPLVQLERLNKTYRVGPVVVSAVRDVSLSVWPGEFVAITGPSGSGKSTLLNLIGLLDTPDSGVYELDGRDVAAINDNERTLLRNRKLGFIFQNSPMLPRLTADENVAVPLLYRGMNPREAEATARVALARVGLATVAKNFPSQLSGGQLQRVAIARAIVTNPKLILADEPVASLDDQTAGEIMKLLWDLNHDTGAAIVMITHELADAARAPRHLELTAGQLREARAKVAAPTA
ncbi:ABC transporter ATP-binding protein [Oleiharenicola lentus]|uniref:ABC transporter ATP-binding protein n=1 Tax=Oleiharenicola lentus TaxID=2508720 RepID=UPI003F661B4D